MQKQEAAPPSPRLADDPDALWTHRKTGAQSADERLSWCSANRTGAPRGGGGGVRTSVRGLGWPLT